MSENKFPELIKCTRNNDRVFKEIMNEYVNVNVSETVTDKINKYNEYKKMESSESINKEFEEKNAFLFQLYIADWLRRYDTYTKKKKC